MDLRTDLLGLRELLEQTPLTIGEVAGHLDPDGHVVVAGPPAVVADAATLEPKFFAGLWEAEPGCWNISYTENEFCQIVAGRSVLRDEQGGERMLAAGDNFVIPAGFRGQWEVLETTKKIYVIYQP